MTSKNKLTPRVEEKRTQGFINFLRENKIRILCLLTLPLLIYANTLGNALVSDDVPYITQDPNISNFLSDYNFQTIKGFFYSWDYFLGQTSPLPYHLTNLTIHLSVVILAFYLLSRIFSRDLSFWTSFIFSVHPLNTEAVAWISGRAYPLYVLFLLLAFLTYLKAKSASTTAPWHVLTAIFFWLSTSVNSFALSLPLILIAYEFCFGHLKKSSRPLAFYLLLALIRVIYISPLITTRVEFLGPATTFSESPSQNLVTPFISLWQYVYLYLFPKNLSFYHEDLSGPYQQRFVLIGLSILVVSLLPFLYRRARTVFFGLSLYVLSLAATLAPIKISWIVAERYSYFGNLGLSLMLSSILLIVFTKLNLSRLAQIIILGGFVVTFATRTFARNFDWKNEDTLWLSTVKTSPTSSKAWNNMGDYYGRRNDPQKSFEAFVRATRLNPEYADAWHNAGNVLLQSGKADESIFYFQKSLEFNPNLIEAYNNLALAYFRKGDPATSAQMIEKSLAINPNAGKTYGLKAALEYEKKNFEAALESLQKALALEPQNQNFQQNLLILQNEIQKAKP